VVEIKAWSAEVIQKLGICSDHELSLRVSHDASKKNARLIRAFDEQEISLSSHPKRMKSEKSTWSPNGGDSLSYR
jgi:hypothetical protein